MNLKKTDNLIFLNQYGGPSNCPSSPPPNSWPALLCNLPEDSEDPLADVLAGDELGQELLHRGDLTQGGASHQGYQVPAHRIHIEDI